MLARSCAFALYRGITLPVVVMQVVKSTNNNCCLPPQRRRPLQPRWATGRRCCSGVRVRADCVIAKKDWLSPFEDSGPGHQGSDRPKSRGSWVLLNLEHCQVFTGLNAAHRHSTGMSFAPALNHACVPSLRSARLLLDCSPLFVCLGRP
jgi:hypothetical protein